MRKSVVLMVGSGIWILMALLSFAAAATAIPDIFTESKNLAEYAEFEISGLEKSYPNSDIYVSLGPENYSVLTLDPFSSEQLGSSGSPDGMVYAVLTVKPNRASNYIVTVQGSYDSYETFAKTESSKQALVGKIKTLSDEQYEALQYVYGDTVSRYSISVGEKDGLVSIIAKCGYFMALGVGFTAFSFACLKYEKHISTH